MDDNAKKALGKRIRQKREELGLSQLELAVSVKKESPAYIAFIEAGERNISAMDLMLIAKRLGTTVSELLGESKEKSSDFVQALRSDKGVPASDKRKIEEYYEFLKNKKNDGNS
jgi:transcriptional regulator with XRE-family HTH domain